MQKITAPFTRKLGVDIDGNVANTPKCIRDYVEDKYKISVDLPTIRRIGISKAYPTLTKEQMDDVLESSWRDPDSIELMHPDIPKFLRKACFGETIHYIPYGLSASRGQLPAILRFSSIHDLPLFDILKLGDKNAKAGTAVDVQIEDSVRVARGFGEAGKPIVLTNAASPETMPLMAQYPSIHLASWPAIPDMLQRNKALLRQLHVYGELYTVIPQRRFGASMMPPLTLIP